jgi:SAM-dependent methyltransferase
MEIKIRNKREFDQYWNANQDTIKKRLSYEKRLSSKCMKGKAVHTLGYCQVCQRLTLFRIDTLYQNNGTVNFRERMVCLSCKLNNRMRFLLARVQREARKYEHPRIYIQEQVTAFFQKLVQLHPNATGSEFLGEQYHGGEIVNGIRHENAAKLSFSDKSFDILISNDVFEHVFDLQQSFSEAFRVLDIGGRMVFSMPFFQHKESTQRRIQIENGELVHLEESQYHGNPLSEDGSLVCFDISWDSFDMLKECGFTDVYMLAYYSKWKGGNIGGYSIFLRQ